TSLASAEGLAVGSREEPDVLTAGGGDGHGPAVGADRDQRNRRPGEATWGAWPVPLKLLDRPVQVLRVPEVDDEIGVRGECVCRLKAVERARRVVKDLFDRD